MRKGISKSGVTSSLGKENGLEVFGCPAKIQPIILTAVKKLETMILGRTQTASGGGGGGGGIIYQDVIHYYTSLRKHS